MCDLVFEDPYFSITYLSKFDKSRNRVYLFVGNVPEHIETILKNFENPEIKKVPSQDLKILKDELLKENYKKTIEYWAELKKSKDLKMKFVFSRMMMDDSLNECKRKIFVHCSDMESDFYILPQNMELWVRDEKDTPHMLGYKYKDMIPHIDAPFELSSFEYTYNMYVDEPLYEEKAKGSRKRILESSDNYTLLYDLCKNIHLKNGMYNIYVSDAYDEYTHLLKTKKYERSDIIQKYLKNYFPVASYERKDIKSMYLLTKDEHQYNDFIVDNLFEYKVDMSQFESCYFNNFILNVNHYGIDDGGVEDALMYGGAGKGKKPIQIMKERNVSGMNSMLPNKKSINQFLNKSGKSRSTGIEIIKEKNLSNENSMLLNKKSINQFLNKKKKPLNFRAHMEDEVEETDFIDLYQIFEYLRSRKIGKKTPFIKYNDYGFANPFILISKSAIDQNVVNKQLLLSQWTNPQMPVKKFNGLQLKRYIKNMEPSGTPLFSNLYLYKYGRIQLSIAFKSENKATFHEIHEAIMNCKDFIEDVNRNVIDYRISRSIDIEKKIIPPESSVHPKRGLELSKNCTIAYMNYFIDYRGGDKIDLKDLFEFCKLFPSFFSIHPTKSLGLNSIKMRYRRVSGFADLDEVMERIERLKKSGAKDGLIIKVI